MHLFHARTPRRLQLRPLVLLTLLALRSPCPGSSLSHPFPGARIRLNGVEHFVRDTGEPAIARNTTRAAPVAVWFASGSGCEQALRRAGAAAWR